MDIKLKGDFFAMMMRLKKLEPTFSSECDMQMNELVILKAIAGHCGYAQCSGMNLNVPEIQEKLQISKPAVSYILNALEKKDYISREIDPKDRRKIYIIPTSQGKAAVEASAQKYDQNWTNLLDQFGESDMRVLIDLMSRLIAAFEQICTDTTKDI